MKATTTDLQRRMKDVLRALDRGETVTVLYRGKEKAKLVPVNGNGAKNGAPKKVRKKPFKTADSPFFGMWKDREDMKNPAAWVRKMREPRYRDI
jgi:antitoxin (DNA-binding transcriptional repressor) of toxin-antitoxin stability system